MKENGLGKLLDKVPVRFLIVLSVLFGVVSVTEVWKVFFQAFPSAIKESGYEESAIFSCMATAWVVCLCMGFLLWCFMDCFCEARQICRGFLEQLLLIVIPADLMGMCGRLYYGWMGKFCKREIVYADHIDQNTYAVYIFGSVFLVLLAFYLIVFVVYLIMKKRRA